MTDIDPTEEIHRIRKKLYAEAGGNPAAYALFLRASQGEGGRKVVSLTGKKLTPPEESDFPGAVPFRAKRV
jgi:hypothetical protein